MMELLLLRIKEILHRFAWDQVVVEKDPNFHTEFQLVKNSNRLVFKNPIFQKKS